MALHSKTWIVTLTLCAKTSLQPENLNHTQIFTSSFVHIEQVQVFYFSSLAWASYA